MSFWAVVQIGEYRHIVPCDGDGVLLEPYNSPSVDCWCEPKIDEEDSEVIIHQDRERGGTNA